MILSVVSLLNKRLFLLSGESIIGATWRTSVKANRSNGGGTDRYFITFLVRDGWTRILRGVSSDKSSRGGHWSLLSSSVSNAVLLIIVVLNFPRFLLRLAFPIPNIGFPQSRKAGLSENSREARTLGAPNKYVGTCSLWFTGASTRLGAGVYSVAVFFCSCWLRCRFLTCICKDRLCDSNRQPEGIASVSAILGRRLAVRRHLSSDKGILWNHNA